MRIDPQLIETLNAGIREAVAHRLVDPSQLRGVTIEDARLPADRIGEFDAAKRLIRVDVPRAAAHRGGVLKTLVHEMSHAATPELNSPRTWHGPDFEAARRGISLGVQVAGLRARRRPPSATKEPHMNQLPILRPARPREYRRAGALSPEKQLALIRAWCSRHPDMASIEGVTFTVSDGRVNPHYDQPRRPSIDARLERAAARAAQWR
jgi:hypothetical protein